MKVRGCQQGLRRQPVPLLQHLVRRRWQVRQRLQVLWRGRQMLSLLLLLGHVQHLKMLRGKKMLLWLLPRLRWLLPRLRWLMPLQLLLL